MVYKTISPKALIAKIYRDYKPNNSGWVNDAFEWMGEAIDCIKPFNGYQDTWKCIDIIDYRGKIPCDLESLQGITYRGKQLKRTGNIRAKRHTCDALKNVIHCIEHTYSLNPNYIHTSFKEGQVVVFYHGLATDNEGFPLIVDNHNVKEAISWYILMKMCLRGFKHPIVTYQMAEAEWYKYYPKAQNSCKMPDIDGYDLFKRTYLGLVSNTQLSNTMFSDNVIHRNDNRDSVLPFLLKNELE